MSQAFKGACTRLLRGSVLGLACAYPFLLIALCAAFVGIGERHWSTASLLYAPRLAFALPVVFLAPLLWWLGAKRLLWTQILSLVVALGPLMGLVLPWPVGAAPGPKLRVLSFNLDSGRAGAEPLLASVDQYGPDVAVFQESPWEGPFQAGLRQRYPYVEASTEFLIASRYPILDRTEPDSIPLDGDMRPARFMRYVLATSLGVVAVYSVHPVSPRGSLGVNRFRDVFHQLGTGAFLQAERNEEAAHSAKLREAQVAAFSEMAARETHPVLLAGDTNLPGLSRALHHYVSDYTDGFRAASWGYGYTFPSETAFMRIDRILAGPALGFEDFVVGCRGASDHRCVVATLFRR
jgi:endonuclease/exonuclease/phosphatase (EEP) superfamily protein YafD